MVQIGNIMCCLLQNARRLGGAKNLGGLEWVGSRSVSYCLMDKTIRHRSSNVFFSHFDLSFFFLSDRRLDSFLLPFLSKLNTFNGHKADGVMGNLSFLHFN